MDLIRGALKILGFEVAPSNAIISTLIASKIGTEFCHFLTAPNIWCYVAQFEFGDLKE